jgi:NAD(P)-dependent dehydrogenase (short-subunit alcohol dehydrogenase family)
VQANLTQIDDENEDGPRQDIKGDTMGKLAGKVAVITGATSGMALATARRFATEGAYVFITGRRQEQLDAAVREIGRNVTGVRGDASNLADLDRLYEAVKSQQGHIDVLYASAGFGEFNVPPGSITEANFDNTFNVNFRGTLFTVQKALPLIRDGGSIIMTGSIASVKGFEGFSVYNASKAAIRSFARTWTVDLKARKIRVNVISPGTIDTGIFIGVPNEVKEQFVSLIPMGRIGQPEEIARRHCYWPRMIPVLSPGSSCSSMGAQRRSSLYVARSGIGLNRRSPHHRRGWV